MTNRSYCAVLVGAAGGIGTAIAQALAPKCEALLLVGRDARRLEELAGRLDASTTVRPVAADIGTAEGRAAVQDAARRMPGVNLLINAAGTSDFAWLADQSEEAVERVVRSNLVAPIQLVRQLLPLLQAQPAATIINVGSILGYLGYPGCAVYSASKFGLRGFTEALRRELGDGPVRVMYLAPRSTRTPFNNDAMYALNAQLGVAVDDPGVVAQALLRMLAAPRRERLLGFPEALFARVNQFAPGLVDNALAKKLPLIRRHARGGDVPADRRGPDSVPTEVPMKRFPSLLLAAVLTAAPLSGIAGVEDDVRQLQQQWAEIKYRTPKAEQEKSFEALAQSATNVREKYAARAEPAIWYGIIVASYAGAKGGLGALSLVKDAKKALEQALEIDRRALDGSAYTSLGSLYYQVPGWPIAFGDEKKAQELLQAALAINPDGIDPNYFLGDLLFRKGDYTAARAALDKALKAPPRPDRALADEGRRKEIEELLARIREKSG